MEKNWDQRNIARLILGSITLIFCFLLIAGDAAGMLDVGKVGYTAIGAWIMLILNFYFRKKGA